MQIRNILSGGCYLTLLAAAGITYAASLSKSDKQFMIMAAKADMTEANEGQLAEHQATRADIKDLAKTLVQDHTESYEHLTRLAGKIGVSIPTGIDTAKNREIQQLVHLKGDHFDQQFDKDEIADHRQAIASFKREADHGQDPEVKAYAAKMVPVLEKHLHLAEECAKTAKRS